MRWVADAANLIATKRLPVYFVESGISGTFYVVVPLSLAFWEEFTAAWRRLAKDGRLNLELFGADSKRPVARWPAWVIHHPEGVADLHDHPLSQSDCVLKVVRPKKRGPAPGKPVPKGPFDSDYRPRLFNDRSSANSALKQGNDR
jgi:hypothetical protein